MLHGPRRPFVKPGVAANARPYAAVDHGMKIGIMLSKSAASAEIAMHTGTIGSDDASVIQLSLP